MKGNPKVIVFLSTGLPKSHKDVLFRGEEDGGIFGEQRLPLVGDPLVGDALEV
jgi:hypothetical protein